MGYILTYSRWRAIHEAAEAGELQPPLKQVLLDGTSSSGKSAVLKDLDTSWAILAADEFYDLLAEAIGKKDFNNKQKVDEVYPGCPYLPTEPGSDDWEKAARWFMVQEVKFGKIRELGLKSRNPEMGRAEGTSNIIYDDVQGTILEEAVSAGLTKPKWILVHAPIDHLKLNVARRPKNDQRSLDGVLIGAYCYKFEAKPKKGGVDPEKSWTVQEVQDLFKGEDWVSDFVEKIGMVKEDEDYWFWPKRLPEGEYDVIVNTRDSSGGQKSLEDLASEIESNI